MTCWIASSSDCPGTRSGVPLIGDRFRSIAIRPIFSDQITGHEADCHRDEKADSFKVIHQLQRPHIVRPHAVVASSTNLSAAILSSMWLITAVGFFSIVRKRGETDVTVRARVRSDLEALRKEYLPSLGPISASGGTDYPYRARIASKPLAVAIARMVEDIDYANFKDTAATR